MSGRARQGMTFLLLGVWLVGCGASDDTAVFDCDRTPPLSWENFGEGFMSTHCEGCHSALVPVDLREGAPVGVDFNSYSDVLQWVERIELRSVDPDAGMPPGGGPSEAERTILHEWLVCGVYPDAEALAED